MFDNVMKCLSKVGNNDSEISERDLAYEELRKASNDLITNAPLYTYQMSQGNPEGTDYTFALIHTQKFSDDEFQDICEKALVEALKREDEAGKSTYIALQAVDTKILFNVLAEQGFKRSEITSEYYLEPYWARENIKNKELLEWAEGKKIKKD